MFPSPNQGKSNKKSHCFPPMNRDHRRIIHDLAQVYGLESVSYDNEPKRNVVVTAVRWVGLAVMGERFSRAGMTPSRSLCYFLLLLEERKGRTFLQNSLSPLPEDPSQRAKPIPHSTGLPRSFANARGHVSAGGDVSRRPAPHFSTAVCSSSL